MFKNPDPPGAKEKEVREAPGESGSFLTPRRLPPPTETAPPSDSFPSARTRPRGRREGGARAALCRPAVDGDWGASARLHRGGGFAARHRHRPTSPGGNAAKVSQRSASGRSSEVDGLMFGSLSRILLQGFLSVWVSGTLDLR